jgi:hypothetical protein
MKQDKTLWVLRFLLLILAITVATFMVILAYASSKQEEPKEFISKPYPMRGSFWESLPPLRATIVQVVDVNSTHVTYLSPDGVNTVRFTVFLAGFNKLNRVMQ